MLGIQHYFNCISALIIFIRVIKALVNIHIAHLHRTLFGLLKTSFSTAILTIFMFRFASWYFIKNTLIALLQILYSKVIS